MVRSFQGILLQIVVALEVPPGVRDVSVQALVPDDFDGDGDADVFVAVHSDSHSGGDA